MQMKTILFKISSVILTFAIMALVNVAFAKGVKQNIRFKPGTSSAVHTGTVERGDRDEYRLTAKAGQEMTVRISSIEDNAVFQIYQTKGMKALDGAAEGEDAMSWQGKLPASGKYTIVVGGTRGNTSYKLEVTIK